MPITLENSLRNRKMVIANVKEEIIGPGIIREHYLKFNPIGNTAFDSKEETYKPYYWEVAGIKEEILQRATPVQRYVSGQLYPLGTLQDDETSLETPLEKEEAGNVSSDALEGLFDRDNDTVATEDDGDVELFPQRNDYMPSTMGLTFSIAKDVPKLRITIEGGSYTPHKVRVKGSEYANDWWLRETVNGSWDLSVLELAEQKQVEQPVTMVNKKGQSISQLQIQFQARLRTVNDQYIITVSVTNRSKLGKIKRDQLILFQAEMEIKTPESYFFSIYPKQYEMKRFLSEDEASTELLYRKEGIYAFGHGCAADWQQNVSVVESIKTTFMPQYETKSMTPNVIKKDGELKIKMSDLAGLSSNDHPEVILRPLIKGYRDWIRERKVEIETLPAALQSAGKKHMELCEESLVRMEKGLALLKDEKTLRAFRLANLAILLQQENGKEKRGGKVEDQSLIFEKSLRSVVKDEHALKNADNMWRAFQIAFILMSIDPLVNEQSETRDIVDLIWFPTGGGKTEAYLGVAAFQMLYRRLLNPKDAGVDIIMRYTLRLLTADQFQRSSRLICALEYIRSKNEDEFGITPYSIGIWVGSQTTPNKNLQAKKMLASLQKNERNAQHFIVHNCPWCGAHLGHYDQKGSKKKVYFGYQMKDNRLVVHCPDKECYFHRELPIHIVDETIYEKRPTFLIGTVDKFVQIVWEPRARSIFGIDIDGERSVNPPSLIIQDELHLISGPLGTLTGLFEVLIEELCIKRDGSKIVKPKIIAATATIKQFEEQSLALFGRKQARLFPSPGLESDDSFFSKPAVDSKGDLMPGRMYVGVYTTNVRIMMSQVMTFSAALQSTMELKSDERDPYWTLLAFYNTLRELGGGLTLSQTDIPQYSKSMGMRKGTMNNMRYLNHVLELTSRKQSHEISKTIDDLKVEYDPENKKSQTIDLCLASNIIEVGVDIDRLSMMAIVGQPKMTAQYIQVSGRVGRRWWERPGVIFTLYANTKSRDKSHFEHFREYHQRLYAQVEPTSVTPFSDSCLERGLHAVIVGFIRQALTKKAANTPDWSEIEKHMKSKIAPFFKRLVERAEMVDPEQVDELKTRFITILKRLEKGNYTSWKVDPKMNGYMYPAGTTVPTVLKSTAHSMMNSMRNVDAECRGYIATFYQNETDIEDSASSWEDLLS